MKTWLYVCGPCHAGFLALYDEGTNLTDFINLCFAAELEDPGTYVPLDSVGILRADLPRRYGGGKALGLQERLTLCDWCGRGRFPLY